jgi:transposase-like protein
MTKRKSQQFWSEHVAAAESCGISKARYCRQHGLTYKTFLRWSSLLQADPGASLAPQSLVPLALTAVSPDAHAPMTLRIGADVSLTMPVSIDAVWLATLLRGVSAC